MHVKLNPEILIESISTPFAIVQAGVDSINLIECNSKFGTQERLLLTNEHDFIVLDENGQKIELLWYLKNAKKTAQIFDLQYKEKQGKTIAYNELVITSLDNNQQGEVLFSLQFNFKKQKDKSLLSENTLNLFIEESSDFISILSEDGTYKYVSHNYFKTGRKPEDYIGTKIFDLIHPDDLEMVKHQFIKCIKDGSSYISSYRFKMNDGKYIWCDSTGRNELGSLDIQGIIVHSRNITDIHYSIELEKLERRILEMNMMPKISINKIVSEYIKGIESLYPETICSILEVKNNRVYNLASPSLPKPYIEAINGLEIGQDHGSCGTAAYTKKKVIVSDIETDPRWENYKTFALQYGLKACWSHPIIDTNGTVLATFAIYYKTIKYPSEDFEKIIDRCGQIIRILLENYTRQKTIIANNERFQYTFKATSDIIWDRDLINNEFSESRYLDNSLIENKEFSNRTNSNWMENIHPDDLEYVKKSLKETLKGKESNWSSEYRYKGLSGEYHIMLDNGYILRDTEGIAIRMVGAMKNVTTERKLQRQLEHSNRLAKMGSWEVDLINNTVDFSPIMKEIHDMALTDTVDVEKGINYYKEGYSRDTMIHLMNRAIEYGESWDKELELITPIKGSKWVRAMGEAEFLNGKCVKLYGNIQDITERKLAEIKLFELNISLEKRAKELALSNNELEQFAYVASHDLQEPLRMITSFLTLLEKKYHDKLDDKAHQYIQFAVDGAYKMRNIILDLLEFSKIGNLEENLESIDLNELIMDIKAIHKKQIMDAQATFTIDKLPIIQSHRSPIRQVFQNLISNALKYHRAGVPSEIKIRCEDQNNHWRFSVEDNGIGIDPNFHQKIFLIFQRLHGIDKYKGTGVGLAICKKVIEGFGGQIWVQSTMNKGSKFIFTLPK